MEERPWDSAVQKLKKGSKMFESEFFLYKFVQDYVSNTSKGKNWVWEKKINSLRSRRAPLANPKGPRRSRLQLPNLNTKCSSLEG